MSDDYRIQRRRDRALLEADDEDEAVGQEDGHEIFGEDDLDRANRILSSHSDQLVAKSRLRQQDFDDASGVAKYVRIQPPSSLGRALGNQQVVNSGQLIQTVAWTGPDNETVPITVTAWPVAQLAQVGSSTFPGPGPEHHWRPYAVAQFGTRGFSVKLEVDIGLGTQFTVSGSSMTLQLGMTPQPGVGGEPNVPTAAMKLAGMISFLPVVRTAPLYRTRWVGDFVLSAALTYLIPIPAAAKTVSYLGGNYNNAGATLNFLTFDAVTVQYKVVPITPMDKIPISDDIIYIVVGDLTGGGAMLDQLARLVFELGV